MSDAMGIISNCLAVGLLQIPVHLELTIRQLTAGLTLATFKPMSPPQIPTSEEVFKSARSVSSDLLVCVPTFLEVGDPNVRFIFD